MSFDFDVEPTKFTKLFIMKSSCVVSLNNQENLFIGVALCLNYYNQHVVINFTATAAGRRVSVRKLSLDENLETAVQVSSRGSIFVSGRLNMLKNSKYELIVHDLSIGLYSKIDLFSRFGSETRKIDGVPDLFWL